MKTLSNCAFALLAICLILPLTPSYAQNPNYAPGDLVLGLQNPGGATGGTDSVMVNLGNTALTFRDGQSDLINITNIGALLTSTFAGNWWEAPTLYLHAAGVRGTSALGTGLVNGDPERTLYISRARAGIGVPGFANSTPWIILGDTDMTNGSSDINAMTNVLETQYTTAATASPTSVSQVDDHNPFIQAGIQGTAYRIFPGGVQQPFGAGSFGIFGAAGDVEAAIDLYRIQARDDLAGQFGQGQGDRGGTFEGTITIDRDGDVSFIAVIPEPSTSILGAFCVSLFAFARQRGKQNFVA
jgi:hypothetical protein